MTSIIDQSVADGAPEPDVASGGWRVGAAMVALPVEPGVAMDGYVARTAVATGVHDRPEIGALLIERGDRMLAILTADVVGVDRSLVDRVVAVADLAGATVIVCASHTHSGPAGIVARLHPAQPSHADSALRPVFVAAGADAVRLARDRLEPAALAIGRARAVGVAANRNDPNGPADDTLTVLTAHGPDGAMRAALVHFACHPTVLGAENLLLSADYPGALRRAIGESWGDPTRHPTVLFANGAAGDVSTRFTRRRQGFDEVDRLGRVLAAAATEALHLARPVSGELRTAGASLTLAPVRWPGEGPIAQTDHVEVGGTSNASAALARQAATRAEGAAMAAALGAAGTPTTVRLDAVALGDVAMVTVPGELLAGLGRRIVERSPFATTLVLGYANDYVGYLIDPAARAAGTYEALASPWSDGAGEAIVDTAAGLVRRLVGERGDR